MPEPNDRSAPLRRWWGRPEQWLVLGACAFAGLSFASVALLILGWFHPATVVPTTAVLTAALAWSRGGWAPVPRASADPRWFWALALLIAAASVGVNAAWANEHTVQDRDPGIYLNAALVLRAHGSPTIPTVWGGFAGKPELDQGAPGMRVVRPGRLGFQGLHLLPAFGAVAAWIGGDNALARVPAALGGLFLLFLMGFARRLVKPPWALVAGAAFALTLPFAYGARDFLSEMVLGPGLFGALWLMAEVLDEGPARRGLLPGALLGAGAMARIDSPLALIGVLGFVGLWLIAHPGRWRIGLAIVGPLLAGVALGAVDGWVNAPTYLGEHASELVGQAALLAGLAVGLVAWWFVGRRWPGSVAGWWRRHHVGLAWGAAGLVVVAVLFGLFVRPSVQQVHAVPRASLIEDLQRYEHPAVPVDGTRSYDEYSVRWLSWYLGPVGLGAAVLASAWLLHRVVRGLARQAELLAVAVLAPPIVVYLYRPSIYPDQPWATRRFLPVVFPMLIVFACWGAAELYERRARARVLREVAVLVAAGTLIFPAIVLAPLWQFRTFNDRLGQVRQVCHVLPANAVLVVVGDPLEVSTRALGTLCGVPAAAEIDHGGVPTRHTLDEVAAAWRRRGRQLWLVSTQPGRLEPLGVTVVGDFRRDERSVLLSSISHRPRTLIRLTVSLTVGRY